MCITFSTYRLFNVYLYHIYELFTHAKRLNMKKFSVFLIMGLCAGILGVALYMLESPTLSYGFMGLGILFILTAVYFNVKENTDANKDQDTSS